MASPTILQWGPSQRRGGLPCEAIYYDWVRKIIYSRRVIDESESDFVERNLGVVVRGKTRPGYARRTKQLLMIGDR